MASRPSPGAVMPRWLALPKRLFDGACFVFLHAFLLLPFCHVGWVVWGRPLGWREGVTRRMATAYGYPHVKSQTEFHAAPRPPKLMANFNGMDVG